MNKKVIVIGAGGHGKVIAETVAANGDEFMGFLDDDESKKTIGKINDAPSFEDAEFIIAIGNNAVRKKISSMNLKWYTAIHPSAVISPSCRIGDGTVVLPNAVINADATVGKHCIINTGAIVEHDNRIGDFSHISVGAKLGGTVVIGELVWICVGASVLNNISICDNCIIGAGSAVVENLTESGKYFGVPAVRTDK